MYPDSEKTKTRNHFEGFKHLGVIKMKAVGPLSFQKRYKGFSGIDNTVSGNG